MGLHRQSDERRRSFVLVKSDAVRISATHHNKSGSADESGSPTGRETCSPSRRKRYWPSAYPESVYGASVEGTALEPLIRFAPLCGDQVKVVAGIE